jgi:hypothetical protein
MRLGIKLFSLFFVVWGFLYIVYMETKVCIKCGEEKPLSKYYKQKGGKLGVKAKCKSCTSNEDRLYYEKNREARLEYYQNNKEKLKAYREANREAIRENDRNYYKKNRDKINAKRRARYKDKKNKAE